jgi:hypothetical protein
MKNERGTEDKCKALFDMDARSNFGTANTRRAKDKLAAFVREERPVRVAVAFQWVFALITSMRRNDVEPFGVQTKAQERSRHDNAGKTAKAAFSALRKSTLSFFLFHHTGAKSLTLCFVVFQR